MGNRKAIEKIKLKAGSLKTIKLINFQTDQKPKY